MVADEIEIRIGLCPVDRFDPQFFERRPEQIERGPDFMQIDDERAREVVAQIQILRIEQQGAFGPFLRALGLIPIR